MMNLNKKNVVVAHGSKKHDYVEYFLSLQKHFDDDTIFCFVEIAKPLFSEVIKELDQEKIDEINVYPYFLFDGYHTKNLQHVVDECNLQHSKVKIHSAFNDNKYIIMALKDKMAHE